ncbi:MAG: hypothetical protein Q9218_003154 [Villophora microphyllina]
MDAREDGFKWFGEGFDGFPKILPDDCAQYMLYCVDAKASDFQIRERLRKVQTAATALCKTLLKGFIWQRDAFNLELIQNQGLSFLQGRSNFGDSVEDEWLIVYLLQELSKQFPQIWIRIIDSDGEFLLVEAADALPKWLNPEVTENRVGLVHLALLYFTCSQSQVWINNRRLLIIPRQGGPKTAHEGRLKLNDALEFIQDRESDLLHTLSIESEAFYRLQKYPQQIQNSLHRAIITIPRKLAYVLHENAAYISPAVEAFYLRDPIALRPLQAKNPSKLLFPPDDLVAVSVKFTKVGYAQLKGQDFPIPLAWVASTARGPHATLLGESEMMGMKVACGFEMLLSDPQNVDKKSVREIQLLLDDLDRGDEQLPSDKDVAKWERLHDDESWLDINFEDFEKELSGRRDPNNSSGFGDKDAQDNLRRLVSRFENFLNDEEGGAQDAEFLDDMDDDNDSDIEDGSGSMDSEGEGDEGAIDFDEDRFDSMMRDMMGLPPTTTPNQATKSAAKADFDSPPREAGESVDEGNNIRKVMHDMENELREAGALSLEPPPPVESHGKSMSSSQPLANGEAGITELPPAGRVSLEDTSSSSVDDSELNVDFARAKEMLARLMV